MGYRIRLRLFGISYIAEKMLSSYKIKQLSDQLSCCELNTIIVNHYDGVTGVKIQNNQIYYILDVVFAKFYNYPFS